MTERSLRVLTKEDLLKPKLETRKIDVPELGGAVVVRGLAYNEVWELRDTYGENDPKSMSYALLARGLVEPAITFEEAKALGEQSVKAVGRILMVINELSGLGEEAIAATERRFPSSA